MPGKDSCIATLREYIWGAGEMDEVVFASYCFPVVVWFGAVTYKNWKMP